MWWGGESPSVFPTPLFLFIFFLFKEKNLKMFVRCHHCGIPFYIKKFRLNRLKNGKISCSRECAAKLKQQIYNGDKNPNFKYEKNLNFIYNMSHDGVYILGLFGQTAQYTKIQYNCHKTNQNLETCFLPFHIKSSVLITQNKKIKISQL